MSATRHEADLLTGAWTRQRFEDELARAIQQSQRAKEPLALLYVDVDEMTEQNDFHGREAVDQALGELAARISDVVDGRGPIGRLGGDKFGVFLKGCGRDPARTLAERIRAVTSERPLGGGAGALRLTVSVGVAVHRRGEPTGNLLEAAERACTRAKQGGRDATVQR